ncbi:hypothetical protein EJ08DRAFT_735768 [Tothia fuscella]|uniref:Uncharacterized protein n=1 Tax=Tothia fuscella TaxID=1048955 RepID=A0A9P4NN36_9PEZI|nr:hypothetical protein EJ08DRAFT_735768 [Tothia fuscella]
MVTHSVERILEELKGMHALLSEDLAARNQTILQQRIEIGNLTEELAELRKEADANYSPSNISSYPVLVPSSSSPAPSRNSRDSTPFVRKRRRFSSPSSDGFQVFGATLTPEDSLIPLKNLPQDIQDMMEEHLHFWESPIGRFSGRANFKWRNSVLGHKSCIGQSVRRGACDISISEGKTVACRQCMNSSRLCVRMVGKGVLHISPCREKERRGTYRDRGYWLWQRSVTTTFIKGEYK